MQHYQGQNYKVNRKVKEEVDKNQINYRESSNDPISVIKRVYIYITDKKGKILRNVNITIDGKTYITSNNGLLISNFPNEEKTITASKKGYKSATTTIILNAENQTHKFFLALETDEEDSEVISSNNNVVNKKPSGKEGFCLTDVLFDPPLNGTDAITAWSGINKTENGVYSAHGSFLTDGWSNEGLWQLEYDVAYSGENVYLRGYVGTMPICSEEVNYNNGVTDWDHYGLTTWEGQARVGGMGMTASDIEGPNQYTYANHREFHHVIFRKISATQIEQEFEDKIWTFNISKLPELTTLHIGGRDNNVGGASRQRGENVLYKNIKVHKLVPCYGLNETVSLNQTYSFTSYADENGETEWGEGIVQIIDIPDDDERFIEVKVLTNEPDDSFIGQTFYIQKNATIGNEIYPLYSDNKGTETGIYVSIIDLYIAPIELNETVQVDEIYEFKSFGDENGETEWGEGTVQIISLPEGDDLYIEVEVKTNSPDENFVGETFYVLKNVEVGNEIYPLYSDEEGTETGIYISIISLVEQHDKIQFINENNEPIEGVGVSLKRNASYPQGNDIFLESDENGYINMSPNALDNESLGVFVAYIISSPINPQTHEEIYQGYDLTEGSIYDLIINGYQIVLELAKNEEENQINETENYTEYEGYMYYIKDNSLSPRVEIRSLIDENSENLIITQVIDITPLSISPTELKNNVITNTIIPISPDEDPNYTFKGYHPSNNNIEYKFFGLQLSI